MYIVTGCAGFIASRLTADLLKDGQTVVGIDNFNDAYDVRLKEYRIAQLQNAYPDFNCIRGDISDRQTVDNLFKNCQEPVAAVFNLAARAGVRTSVLNPWVYYDSNVLGSLNLLNGCVENGISKFVLASTSSLYGNCSEGQFRETDNTDRPLSPYAASKKAAEALAYSYYHLHGIDISISRFFTVYGPAGRPDMSIFRFIRHIDQGEPIIVFGDGTQARDFTFVDDIVHGVRLAEKQVGYDIFNFGGNRVVVLNDLIDLIGRILGKPVRVDRRSAHRADVQRTSACIDHAEEVLGWRPERAIEQGVIQTVEWYLQNRDLALKINLGE